MEKKQLVILGLLSISGPAILIAVLLWITYTLNSEIFTTIILKIIGPIAGLVIFVGIFLLFSGIFKRS